MTETSTRTPSRSPLLWILLATTCCLAGWILSDLTRADAAPPPSAPAAAASADAVAPPPTAVAEPAPAAAPTVVVVTVPAAAELPAAGQAGSAAVAATVSAAPAAQPAGQTSARRAARPAAGASAPARGPGEGVTQAPAPSAPSTWVSWLQVVASDGAVVLVGPDGQLVANTGDAATGGAVVLESQGSLVATTADGSGATPGSSTLVQPDLASARTVTGSAAGTTRTTTGTSAVDQGTTADPRTAAAATFDHVAFSGYEDHSLRVGGNRNLIAYDDANLFVDHVGRVDANTGDTDSSGINAVDVTGSVIRSGASGGVEDEAGEEPEEEESVEPVSPDDAASAPAATSAPAQGAAVATSPTPASPRRPAGPRSRSPATVSTTCPCTPRATAT